MCLNVYIVVICRLMLRAVPSRFRPKSLTTPPLKVLLEARNGIDHFLSFLLLWNVERMRWQSERRQNNGMTAG